MEDLRTAKTESMVREDRLKLQLKIKASNEIKIEAAKKELKSEIIGLRNELHFKAANELTLHNTKENLDLKIESLKERLVKLGTQEEKLEQMLRDICLNIKREIDDQEAHT